MFSLSQTANANPNAPPGCPRHWECWYCHSFFFFFFLFKSIVSAVFLPQKIGSSTQELSGKEPGLMSGGWGFSTAVFLTGHVTLNYLVKLPVPQCPHFSNGDTASTLQGMASVQRVMQVPCLAPRLAADKCCWHSNHFCALFLFSPRSSAPPPQTHCHHHHTHSLRRDYVCGFRGGTRTKQIGCGFPVIMFQKLHILRGTRKDTQIWRGGGFLISPQPQAE